MTATRHTCPDCKGAATDRRGRPCATCAGQARVTIDPDAIRRAIRSTQGPNRYHLRQSNCGMRSTFGAQYVWRMARFHGGADTTMPVMCFYSIGVYGLIGPEAQAVLDLLDPLADEAAFEEYGTDTAAAQQWAVGR